MALRAFTDAMNTILIVGAGAVLLGAVGAVVLVRARDFYRRPAPEPTEWWPARPDGRGLALSGRRADRRQPTFSGWRTGSPARASGTVTASPAGRLRSSRTMYSGRCLTSS